MITPLFKSHFSIGKSILTLDSPKDSENTDSADSVFSIVKDSSLDKVVLVEDSFMGFLQAMKVSKDISKQLVFGVRLDICEDLSSKEENKKKIPTHKVIVFPKNAEGCKLLNSIYTACKTKHDGLLDLNLLKSMWSKKNLSLAVPFYDSFIYYNIMSFNSWMVDLSFASPTFFIESNGLPFDSTIAEAVENYCKANKFPTEKTQSIYYKNKSDFSAYVAYKLICSRNSFAGRELSLEKPNMDHLCSDEFCWESYLEKCDT